MINPRYYGVGYMNAYHQRVVAHGQTRLDRSPVMVIQCTVCGHYYGAGEARLAAQRCPSHDEGVEGQTAAADIEWLEKHQSPKRITSQEEVRHPRQSLTDFAP